MSVGVGGPTETCRLLQSDGVRKIPAHIPASLHFIGPWFLHLPLLPASRLTMSRLFWNLTSCAQCLNPGGTEFYKPPILETHTPLKKKYKTSLSSTIYMVTFNLYVWLSLKNVF